MTALINLICPPSNEIYLKKRRNIRSNIFSIYNNTRSNQNIENISRQLFEDFKKTKIQILSHMLFRIELLLSENLISVEDDRGLVRLYVHVSKTLCHRSRQSRYNKIYCDEISRGSNLHIDRSTNNKRLETKEKCYYPLCSITRV